MKQFSTWWYCCAFQTPQAVTSDATNGPACGWQGRIEVRGVPIAPLSAVCRAPSSSLNTSTPVLILVHSVLLEGGLACELKTTHNVASTMNTLRDTRSTKNASSTAMGECEVYCPNKAQMKLTSNQSLTLDYDLVKVSLRDLFIFDLQIAASLIQNYLHRNSILFTKKTKYMLHSE